MIAVDEALIAKVAAELRPIVDDALDLEKMRRLPISARKLSNTLAEVAARAVLAHLAGSDGEPEVQP